MSRLRATVTVAPELTLSQRAEALLTLKADLEGRLEVAKSELKALIVENNGEPIIAAGKRVSYDLMDGRKTLDKTKLAAQGVTTDVLEAATKKGNDYMQLNIRQASKADLAAEEAA